MKFLIHDEFIIKNNDSGNLKAKNDKYMRITLGNQHFIGCSKTQGGWVKPLSPILAKEFIPRGRATVDYAPDSVDPLLVEVSKSIK